MIMDKLSEFADAATISTAATGRAVFGSAIDMGTPPRDIGAGQPVYLVITIDTAVAGTSSTVSFELVSDAQSPVAVDATATLHWASMAIPEASLVAGYKIVVPLPSVKPEYERYLGLITNVGSAVLTAGKANAFLTLDPHGYKSYPEGNN